MLPKCRVTLFRTWRHSPRQIQAASCVCYSLIPRRRFPLWPSTARRAEKRISDSHKNSHHLQTMCPKCDRYLAYPVEECKGGRCPHCGFKPGESDRADRLDKKPPDVAREPKNPNWVERIHPPNTKHLYKKTKPEGCGCLVIASMLLGSGLLIVFFLMLQ